jgi:WhiB family redox-sensing transcriptional regulator
MIAEPTPPWFVDAACKGLNPNVFMPQRGENNKVKEAKKICEDCPVQQQCRDYGLRLSQLFDTHGIFGGWTRQERKKELERQGLNIRRWGTSDMSTVNHGSNAAYLMHTYAGEEPCELCQEGKARRSRNRVLTVNYRHGTPASYRRHIALGERPCHECDVAYTAQMVRNRKYNRQYRQNV